MPEKGKYKQDLISDYLLYKKHLQIRNLLVDKQLNQIKLPCYQRQKQQLLGWFDLPFACVAPHASPEPKIIKNTFSENLLFENQISYACPKCQNHK